MKRVDCYIGALSSGGAERQMVLLTSLLADNYEVSLTTYADIPDHYELNSRIARKHICQGKTKLRKVVALFFRIWKRSPDAIISFEQRTNFLTLIPLLLKKSPIVIVGERNYTRGHSSRIERVLFRHLYKRADFIVPNSKSQGDYISEICPRLASKIKVIHNYTHVQVEETANETKSDVLRIGVFARYAPQKNLKNLILAVSEICKGKHKVKVEWFGNKNIKDENAKAYFNDCQKLITENNLSDIFILNDHVENVTSEMLRFDAICLPSFFEGFSNVIAEAICVGKPVLASDVSDNSVMVHENENGFLFNPKEPEDIAKAISRFIELTPEQKHEMGEKSEEIAQELFSKEKFINDYVDLIEFS